MNKQRAVLVTAVFFAVVAAFAGVRPAAAQADPREVLRSVIQQLQTGTPNPLWYGQDLWMTIALQTNNTGVYPQLRQLGPVRKVQIDQQLPLFIGTVYGMTATHQNGKSTWELGISGLSNRIEYAKFVISQAEAFDDDDEPASQPKPQPKPSPAEQSEACKKFPNLC